MSKRTLSSLLPGSLLLAAACACGTASYSRPDLPQSVAPGWSLTSLDAAQPPPELPATRSPHCWKAIYSGPGSVQMWICGYASETSAFDAAQRARAAAQTVKFQEGKRLILVHYDENTKHTDLESLIRAIQKRLKP